MKKFFCIQVPGKILLGGEYAVLFGGSSLSTTLSLFLRCEVCSTGTKTLRVESSLWESPRSIATSDLLSWAHHSEIFLRTLGIIASQIGVPLVGTYLKIDSQLDPSYGFGSSSAVCLAGGLALKILSGKPFDKNLLMDTAKDVWKIQKDYQSRASGYDVLTQAIGGSLFFSPTEDWPKYYEEIHIPKLSSWVHVMVGGAGAKTAPAIQNNFQKIYEKRELFLKASQKLVDALKRVRVDEWESLISAVKDHRIFLKLLDNYPKNIEACLQKIPGYDEDWTWKTTGAGGEDAILLLGHDVTGPIRALEELGWRKLLLNFETEGCIYAEI